ncbi:MAG: OmpA family protein [Cytophagaceae bacterium]|nr:OmpA family protein [Cytophagaceae bacterium]MDW8457060.1 OmpA family protein [Cytophagaceae bacterium]
MKIKNLIGFICAGFLFQFCVPPKQMVSTLRGDCGGPDDGRFTIGANNIRLMYGFPIPASTSHFVLYVDGKYASNYSGLGNNVKHVCTTKRFKTEGNRKYAEMDFYFEGIKLTQRLIPVDGNLNETDSLKPARYYRIEYQMENETATTKSVGLQLLLDNMIADNDAPKLDADGKRIRVETKFSGSEVPGQVFLYRTEGDLSDHTAEILTKKAKAVVPDELAIGRWPYFHKVVWDYTPGGIPYTDAAVMIRWNPQPLTLKQKRTVAIYYGMARKTKNAAEADPGIAAAFTEKESATLIIDTIFFDNADVHLTPAFTKKIDDMLAGKNLSNIQGILIEGHTDAKGSEEANIEYSRKRAKTVSDYFVKKGVAEYKIVPKGYGEMYANQSEECQKNGNAKDRNSVITLYYKP